MQKINQPRNKLAKYKKYFFYTFCILFTECAFGQVNYIDNKCMFFSEIYNYIKNKHKEQKKIQVEIDTITNVIVKQKLIKKYDLNHFINHPILDDNYNKNIFIDTLGFFTDSCIRSMPLNSNYTLSNIWLSAKDISDSVQLIRLVKIVGRKSYLILIFNSNKSKNDFGYFYFYFDKKKYPRLTKIRWKMPDFRIDD
jgi:hypothetical protein